jgi:hypothetical protein
MEDLQEIKNHEDGHDVNQVHNHQIDINYESTPNCIVRTSGSSVMVLHYMTSSNKHSNKL